jgi:type I restriction enzyme S subunit
LLQTGGNRDGLSADAFKKFHIVLPSSIEQQEIADYLDKKCSEIDQLISIKQQKIVELNDYKKSLIYEYTTGKKEVKL